LFSAIPDPFSCARCFSRIYPQRRDCLANIAAFNRRSRRVTDIENQINAIRKAQNFYDRILDGYGDDPSRACGAHLALENISMLAAKY